MKILANDGISSSGRKKLEEAGYEVILTKVAQEQLANYIQKKEISILLVRSATKVKKEILGACPGLQLIGRAGVGLDNIDTAYAAQKKIKVINTPSASSRSVAELVFAHLFTGVRHLQKANREMPLEGEFNFKYLKKAFAGRELFGRTLGIIGFGNIGREVAKLALGIGMKVMVNDLSLLSKAGETLPISLLFSDGQSLTMQIALKSKEELLQQADFITIHVPRQKEYVIGAPELELMKKTAGLINTARGGVVDEEALDKALTEHRIAFAALDVFKEEPHPPVKLLMNPNISFSPHIGGATEEAQERIGLELAQQIIATFGKQN